MLKETKVIENVCPLFSGFYGTFFEADETQHLDFESEHYGVDIHSGYINIDNEKYMESVAKFYTGEIEELLKEMKVIESMTYQRVHSPREYNFSTDEIHVEIKITSENHDNIIKWIEENTLVFAEYINEKFSHRSGFHSFYSNDWEELLEDLKNDDIDENQYRVILECILSTNDDLKSDDDYMTEWGANNDIGDFCSWDEENIPTKVMEIINEKDNE